MIPLPEPPKGNDRLALEVHRLMHHYGMVDGDELYRAMRAYGDARAAEERERCAKLCEDLGYLLEDSGAYAAAIRKGE